MEFLRGFLKVFTIFITLFIAGCSQKNQELTPSEPTQNISVDLSGKSQAFRDGFDAGCKSARGTFTQDEERFISDEEYNDGWYRGKKQCQGG